MATSPNTSIVQTASPNVHHRLLNFMRPEGMSTGSPAQIQQSLQLKYRSELTLLWMTCVLQTQHVKVSLCFKACMPANLLEI